MAPQLRKINFILEMAVIIGARTIVQIYDSNFEMFETQIIEPKNLYLENT